MKTVKIKETLNRKKSNWKNDQQVGREFWGFITREELVTFIQKDKVKDKNRQKNSSRYSTN